MASVSSLSRCVFWASVSIVKNLKVRKLFSIFQLNQRNMTQEAAKSAESYCIWIAEYVLYSSGWVLIIDVWLQNN